MLQTRTVAEFRLQVRPAAAARRAGGEMAVLPKRTRLDGLVLCGYQGWFLAEGDGMNCGWRHWFHSDSVEPAFDLWPDTSELNPNELFPSPIILADGSPGMLFSSCNAGNKESVYFQ